MDDFYFVGKVPVSARQEAWTCCLPSIDAPLPVSAAEWAPLTYFFLEVLRKSKSEGTYTFPWPADISGEEKKQFLRLLWQLGAEPSEGETELHLKCFGWRQTGDALHLNLNRFPELGACFLVLCFELPFDLFLASGHSTIERHHLLWEALQFVSLRGLRVDAFGGELRILRGQYPNSEVGALDPDLTKAFFIMAMAAVSGHATLVGFYPKEYQESALFPLWLRRMNVPVTYELGDLRADGPVALRGIEIEVNELSDNYVLLAAVAACAQGESRLRGQGLQCRRTKKLIEILHATNAKLIQDGRDLVIQPSGEDKKQMSQVKIETGGDSLLNMAVTILSRAGWPIKCLEADSILHTVYQLRGVH